MLSVSQYNILLFLRSVADQSTARECAARARGIYAYLNDLRFLGYVTWKDPLTGSTIVRITKNGKKFLKKALPTVPDDYDQVARIIIPIWRGKSLNIDPQYVFVLMPLGKKKVLEREIDFDEIFAFGIRPAVEEICKMRCERADDIFHHQGIIDVIWESINRARIIIADMSLRNPNVFYEIGICHTLGKDVILITQDGEDVPFDIRHLKYIMYTSNPRGLDLLQKDLVKTITMTLHSGVTR